MYFHPESNRTFTDHSAIRRAFSDGSMPFVVAFENIITEDILAELGVFPIEAVASGAGTDQIATEGAPELVDSAWRQTWIVRAATAEEAAGRAAEWTAKVDAAIAKTYLDVDGVVRDAVGLRSEEYKDAEIDARAYAASGYAGDAPESVACFARSNPTGVLQTGQWAADQIIARADAFAAAKLSMRSNRMDRQADMRAATTAEELAAVAASWGGFIAVTRAELGL